MPSAEDTPTADCLGCLLKDRIESARPGETIEISAGIYTLDEGELVFDKNLSLIGAGPEVTVIQAATSLDLATHRVVRVTEESTVSISGVTIRYGKEASIERRIIPFHSDAIGMTSSGIESIFAEIGGGIYNQGTLTLADSIVTENYAGGGAGIFNGAKIFIETSVVTANQSGGYGGGIFNGAILNASNIEVTDNSAGAGGGMVNWGNASITTSVIRGNHAVATGGGIYNTSVGNLDLDSSAISHNQAVIGGGINNYGRIQVINSTNSENNARLSAGIDSRGDVKLANSTITGNVANEVGGLGVRPIVRREGIIVSNSIIAGNTAEQGPDCMGMVTSLGHNLVGLATDCEFSAAEGDQVGSAAQPIDARLEQLKMNGGPTHTNALLSGSPAINAGDGDLCPATDQRGIPRPGDTSCDIGAYER